MMGIVYPERCKYRVCSFHDGKLLILVFITDNQPYIVSYTSLASTGPFLTMTYSSVNMCPTEPHEGLDSKLSDVDKAGLEQRESISISTGRGYSNMYGNETIDDWHCAFEQSESTCPSRLVSSFLIAVNCWLAHHIF
jgi:hypothetical protein